MLFASQPLLLAAQAACTPSQLFVVAVCVGLPAYCPKKSIFVLLLILWALKKGFLTGIGGSDWVFWLIRTYNFCDKILNECVGFSLLTFPELGPSFIVLSTINNDFSSSSMGQHNIAWKTDLSQLCKIKKKRIKTSVKCCSFFCSLVVPLLMFLLNLSSFYNFMYFEDHNYTCL